MSMAPWGATLTKADERPTASGAAAEAALRAILSRFPKADPVGRLPDVHPARIPRHIAIIMDGNGRWAQRRGFPREFGHRSGAESVRKTLEEAAALGVEFLTLYSFSSENWKRPAGEIEALMRLCVDYCTGEASHLAQEDVRVKVIGRREGLPAQVLEAIGALEAATADCRGVTLCLAINYGSRAEIAGACRRLAEAVERGEMSASQVDERAIALNLDTAGMPDPDLLVRTAGEMRLSNYLLWQLSYAEIHVTETLWPDFGPSDLHAAIRDYAARDRRYGGLGPGHDEPAEGAGGPTEGDERG